MPFPFRVSYFSWIPFWQNLKCLIPQTRPKLLRAFEAGPDFEKKEKILKKAFRNLVTFLALFSLGSFANHRLTENFKKFNN